MADNLKLLEDIGEHINNPSYTVNAVMEYMLGDTKDITDAANPFINLLEAGAIFASSALDTHNTNLGYIYASLATTKEEVYRHLPSHEFANIFALGDIVTFDFFISLQDLNKHSIIKDNYKTSLITKGAVISAGNSSYVVNEDYWINLYNGVPRVYTVDANENRVMTTSDVIRSSDGTEYLVLKLAAFNSRSFVGSFDVSRSGVFRKSISVSGEFSRAEAYTLVNGSYKRVDISYSMDRYDRYNPVVNLTVSDNIISVYISPMYTTTGILSNIHIICYHVDDNPTSDFENVPSTEISLLNKSIINPDNDEVIRAFNKCTLFINTDIVVTKGRRALPLSEVHKRLVLRASDLKNNLPLTRNQMQSYMADYGYVGILQTAHSANVQQSWILSSELPLPSNNSDMTGDELMTPPEAGFINITTTMDKLAKIGGVRSTSYSVTIPPEVFYSKTKDGGYETLDYGYSNSLSLLAPLALADTLNKTDIYYSPYYYNLYRDGDYIHTRVLDYKHPEIYTVSTSTLTKNTNLVLVSDQVNIRNTQNSFELTLTTLPSPTLDGYTDGDVFIQLSWVHESVRYWIITEDITKVDGAYKAVFVIKTDFEVDLKGRLVITNALTDLSNAYKSIPMPEDERFSVSFGLTSTNSNYTDNSIDEYIHRISIGDARAGVTLEIMHFTFGKELTHLWKGVNFTDSRSELETYDEDIPLRYEYTSIPVSSRNPAPFSINSDCHIEFNDAIKEGSIVTDDDGNIVYAHRKGEVIFGMDGRPINASTVKREFDIDIWVLNTMCFFLKGAQKTYIDNIVKEITKKSTIGIQPIVDRLLEHTKIYHYPRNSIGLSSNSDQSVLLKQYLTVDVFSDSGLDSADVEIRKLLRRHILTNIHKALGEETVSVTGVSNSSRGGLSVYDDVAITGLGGNTVTKIILLGDGRDRLIIAKKLIPSDAGYVKLTEDISIIYNRR